MLGLIFIYYDQYFHEVSINSYLKYILVTWSNVTDLKIFEDKFSSHPCRYPYLILIIESFTCRSPIDSPFVFIFQRVKYIQTGTI